MITEALKSFTSRINQTTFETMIIKAPMSRRGVWGIDITMPLPFLDKGYRETKPPMKLSENVKEEKTQMAINLSDGMSDEDRTLKRKAARIQKIVKQLHY